MRSLARREIFFLENHTQPPTINTVMAHNTNQGYVSVELDIPTTLAKALEDDAAEAGLSLDDYVSKVASEQLSRSNHLEQ